MKVRMAALLRRWLKFNAVGAIGICVQMLAVYLLGAVWKISSLWTTALAVEAAVLHNFVWHEHFTWADRHAEARVRALRRLLVFNLTIGAISIVGNLLCVWSFMHQFRAPLLVANLLAIAVCSIINFVVNDRIVFRAAGKRLGISRPKSALVASH